METPKGYIYEAPDRTLQCSI